MICLKEIASEESNYLFGLELLKPRISKMFQKARTQEKLTIETHPFSKTSLGQRPMFGGELG